MKFTGICLVTEDVPRLVRFYTEVPGCQAEGNDGHAEFSPGGACLAIFTRWFRDPDGNIVDFLQPGEPAARRVGNPAHMS